MTSSDSQGNEQAWHVFMQAIKADTPYQQATEHVAIERTTHTVYPDECNVFAWTRYCSPSQVKVVIVGQDPYHGPKQAHGLAFSVPDGVASPPSLKNILLECKACVPGFRYPFSGSLVKWAEQGVLLLNSCLTVRKGEPNSHKNVGWERVTDAIIHKLAAEYDALVFCLWGAYAQQKQITITSANANHCILKAAHPSPYSAGCGFFGCKHFALANDYLIKHGKEPIEWKLN